jgi:hypothetical protein
MATLIVAMATSPAFARDRNIEHLSEKFDHRSLVENRSFLCRSVGAQISRVK